MRISKAAVILILTALTVGCSIPQKQTGVYYAMDTVMEVTIYDSADETLTADIGKELKRLERLFSVTDEESEIYRINHSGGQPVEISAETAELVEYSLRMSESTGGALDITLYPILKEWGFTTGEYRIPAADRIEELLTARGEPVISDGMVTIPNGTELDLGAVAKGYTGDVLAEMLHERGVTSALLNLGGNIHAVGENADKASPWRVGIADPFGDGNIGILELADMAAVTSGSYERYFIGEDGKHYCHIIDPESGFPADNGLVSVTVVGTSGVMCDSLSTALFVMGEREAIDYWRNNSGFELILVDSDGNISVTEGLASLFTVTAGFPPPIYVYRNKPVL